MPVFELTDQLIFPHPAYAAPSGLLAVGGDLSTQRLILAYSNGIFPWFSEDDPIMWWSPNPRMVLFPHEFKTSKSLRKTLRSNTFEVRMNTCFPEVIKACSEAPRKSDTGETWISPDMQHAYIRLHRMGYAHSFETFHSNRLVGGLYGVRIGSAFFGESMFHYETDASKVALSALTQWCVAQEIRVIDAQQSTPHLASLGAREIPRSEFLSLIRSEKDLPSG